MCRILPMYHIYLNHDTLIGCDASVLLDSTTQNTAKKDALPNQTLQKKVFNMVDDIKAEVEKKCLEIVSCADIMALAARDSVSFQYKRSLWEVPLGRRDGTISHASEAIANIPPPTSNFDQLKQNFAGKGLDVLNLVVLSVPMDPTSSEFFYTRYYKILLENEGLFQSDAALLTDDGSLEEVKKLLSFEYFLEKFAHSMKNMGEIQVLAGTKGQILKKKRRVVN
ncbi:peroxidase 3 [Quercus suber]|uniref:peroxidase n=1 Tax=Quercus suber TaxID=58331 RepID=A0AAW0M9U3_QUESU